MKAKIKVAAEAYFEPNANLLFSWLNISVVFPGIATFSKKTYLTKAIHIVAAIPTTMNSIAMGNLLCTVVLSSAGSSPFF